MNLKEHLETARVEYVGAILASLAEQLDRCHLCLGARFGEEIPGRWTYGSVVTRPGCYEGRVWQQSGMGPAEYMEPGALLATVGFRYDLVTLLVTRESGARGAWVERTFGHNDTTATIAGWIVDQWEALVCQARGYAPLDTNRRCYV